ncbi:MAG: hypothetical protein ACJ77B_03575 [Chloroflexota bacterium]
MTDQKPTTTDELVRRIEEGWRSFRPAVDAVRGNLRATTLSGWTRLGMLGHVAGWQEVTGPRLDEWLRTGTPPDAPDEDEFNARTAADAERDGEDATLRRLDVSYTALLDAVRRIPTERLTDNDGWPASVVAGNSYDHWQEHEPELRGS